MRMSKKDPTPSIQLLDVQQSAELLGVNVGTIRRWAQNNQLTGIKVGIRGDWRFTKNELLRMVKRVRGTEEQLQTILTPEKQDTLQASPSLPRSSYEIVPQKKAGHFVQYYENDEFLIESLSKFIGEGLRKGETCITAATKEHTNILEERLVKYGLNIIDAKAKGQYMPLDASGTLSKFMVDGKPDANLFFQVIGSLLEKSALRGQKIRIFGEMVALLWSEGNQQGAVELEKLWNQLAELHSFSLYCAYPINGFDREIHSKNFSEIGMTHSHVIPAESYTELTDEDEKLRTIAKLQQKAESLQAEIEERKKAEKQKEDLLCMASHELKTPLTSMKIFISILKKQLNGNENGIYYTEKINDQINKLNELIRDLLDLSCIETGKLSLKKESFNLSELVKETVNNIQITADNHTILFTPIHTVEIIADKYRLNQVITNLLTNAIKYSPKGEKIIISLRKINNEVMVSVQDFGIGINKEELTKVFEKLYQSEEAFKNTYPGLGLSLYISQEIIERHQGKIWAESKKRGGTTFFFTLPLYTSN